MAHRIQEPKQEKPALHVLARGDAMVPDYAALIHAHTKRFVGRNLDASVGEEFTDPESGLKRNQGAFVKLVDTPVTIPADSPYMAEYVRHVKDGDLWAADAETAAACGMPFEPDFGGEHPEASKKHQKVIDARKAAAAQHTAAAKKAEADAAAQRNDPATRATQPPPGEPTLKVDVEEIVPASELAEPEPHTASTETHR